MRTTLRGAVLIAGKDLRVELRSRDILTAIGLFALLAVVIFNFSFEPGVGTRVVVAPGILWVAFIFAGLLGLNRSFSTEQEHECIEGLVLCPVDREAIYIGKLLGNLAFMAIAEAVLLPVFGVLLQVDLTANLGALVLAVVLGTIGFCIVGTLFAAVCANTRAREAMLPILLLPVCVPVVIAAVKVTSSALSGGGISEMASWLQLLIGFDVLFAVLSFVVFEFVLEE